MGTDSVDLSNWFITDNKDLERLNESEEWRITEGTVLNPGEVLVVEHSDVLDNLSLGKEDAVILYDNNNQQQDSFSYNGHAAGTYSRVPDGTGEFVDQAATKGELNIVEEEVKPEYKLVLNEVNSSPDDWVEVMNLGTGTMDLSGYEIRDNSDDHRWQFAEGAKVEGRGIFVIEATTVGKAYNDETNSYVEGTFESAIGIGSGDSIRIYDREGNLVDTCSWTEHASYDGDPALASIGRYPDGTGEFVDFATSTKGKLNIVTNPVVINEVQSKDPNGGADWIELANPTNADIDISGIVIKDNDDTHAYTIPEATITSANGFLVIDENELGFGFGKGDSVRLYEGDMLIGSTTWSEHTNPTWGIYPDVNGTEYRNTKEETPGAINKFDGVPEVMNWPGQETTTIYDEEPTFLEDSSGLDFYNGQLYAVDNGTGRFWILDVAEDGSISFTKGFENGKRVRFQKDAGNSAAAGPGAEGITVDGSGMVYLASERDNSAKGVNYNYYDSRTIKNSYMEIFHQLLES